MMRKFRFLQWFLLAFLVVGIPSISHAQVSIGVGISVHIGPPALPVYAQPVCPGVGYLWTPGYWAWGADGYFWVPGTWVLAPRPGFLWTPGYWGWAGGVYVWHGGYWGPHIGFYGGINYGFGYGGVGFGGGEWRGGHFFYNSAVSNVNVNIVHNTYINKTVIVNNNTHVAFNGGAGGVQAQPTREEMAAANEEHIQATSAQMDHEHTASMDRNQLASVNHGRPAYAATPRPGDFRQAEPARGAANVNRADNANRGGNNFDRPNNNHPNNDHPNNSHNNGGNKNENKSAHNSKPPKNNNHPEKENHKPGPGR
jgi:hypothetical protein